MQKNFKKLNIINLQSGDKYFGDVKILKKTIPGPIIFSISDGYGVMDAVIKDSNFNVDDVVKISGKVSERAGKLQIELESIKKSDIDFEALIDKNSEPQNTNFSIKSEKLEKLKPYFFNISKRIRKAILENQPLIIRHHADSDGINAGLAIEHSSRMLMEKIGLNPEFNLYRSPSRAPFYEIIDVLKDVSFSKKTLEAHGQKKPLFIALDNGSTPEDVFGLKTLKILGFESIVIDHHNPVIIDNKKTLVDPYLSFHLNPYIEGFDSQICAGMLAYELAKWIFKDFNNPAMPAVAALTDRSNSKEADQYIEKSQRTKKELEEIGIAIDFIAYQLKFAPGKGLFEELYKNPELVKILNQEVRKGTKTQLESTLPYLRTRDISGVILSDIDLEKYTMKFKYPTPGKVIGMIHDTVSAGREEMPIITLGYLSDMIILRATRPVLPIAKIIERIKQDVTHAGTEGGGHECAGTIKFTPGHLTAILENIKKQISELNYLENSQELKNRD